MVIPSHVVMSVFQSAAAHVQEVGQFEVIFAWYGLETDENVSVKTEIFLWYQHQRS
jgi:hypothetical protein